MSRTTRWILLFLILLCAVGLRFWRITSLPPGFHLDESFEGLEAWRILTDPHYRPLFLTGNFGVPVLNAYANALMFGLFGLFGGEAGPTAMRVTAACFGVLGVWALYGLATELRRLDKSKNALSPAFPLFAAAMLAMMRWDIHFSRIGIEPIIVPLLWASALWCLLRGWRTGQWLNFVGCGVLLAASVYTYQAAWIIPLLMIPLVLLLLLGSIRKKTDPDASSSLPDKRSEGPTLTKRLIGLILTALVAFLLFAPFGWYMRQNPDIVTLRTSQVAASTDTEDGERASVWRNLRRTALMYGPLGAPGDQNVRRNIPGEPVLNVWEAILFYAGLGIAVWRIRRPGYALVLISLLGLLLPGGLSQHAPHFHRLLGAAAPTALLGALPLDWLWRWGQGARGWGLGARGWGQGTGNTEQGVGAGWWTVGVRRGAGWVAVLLLLLGGVTSARNYFVRWANLPELYYAFDVGLWQIGREIAQMPAPGSPLGAIYMTPKDAGYPTVGFALRNSARPAPIGFDGRHIFPLTAEASPQPELYVVIEHEDFRTRLLLPEIFPQATVQKEFFDRQGKVYARYYVRPANITPQRPPQNPLKATLGDGIGLAGYDVQPDHIHPGEVLYLQLHWLVDAAPKANWTVFTHLLTQDAAGNVKLVAGQDNPPGENTFPTERWQKGWRILDEYQIHLPSDLQPGEYQLEIGLYQANGEHLPANGAGVLLGKVKIE